MIISNSTDSETPITFDDRDLLLKRAELEKRRHSLLDDLEVLEKDESLECADKEEKRRQLAGNLDKVRRQLTRLDDEEQSFAADLERRVVSLLEAYGCSPTEEGWRRLALQLAVRHREPGFEIKLPPSRRRPMEDEHVRWDQMIEAHLDPPANTGLKRCGSVAEAARLVSKHLQREWQAGDRSTKKPPAAASLASQYSARNAGRSPDELRAIPLYMLQYLRMLSVFRALVAAAVRVGNRSSTPL